MKPSPPKKPAPRRRCSAIDRLVPSAAQRKASFWQMKRPPSSLMFSGMILPG